MGTWKWPWLAVVIVLSSMTSSSSLGSSSETVCSVDLSAISAAIGCRLKSKFAGRLWKFSPSRDPYIECRKCRKCTRYNNSYRADEENSNEYSCYIEQILISSVVIPGTLLYNPPTSASGSFALCFGAALFLRHHGALRVPHLANFPKTPVLCC